MHRESWSNLDGLKFFFSLTKQQPNPMTRSGDNKFLSDLGIESSAYFLPHGGPIIRNVYWGPSRTALGRYTRLEYQSMLL